MKKIIILMLLLLITLPVFAQSSTSPADKEKAIQLAKQAIELINQKQTEEAVKLLQEAQKLDSSNITYPYEIAVAYYDVERYSDVSRILEALLSHPDCNDRVYQLLGNSLDFLGNRDRASAIYLMGIKKFPNSGRLYMEMGIMEMQQENEIDAMKNWAQGTIVDPNFANLHYRIAHYYYDKKRYLLALVSAESFLNLTNSGSKFEEISKMIYDIYTSHLCKQEGCVKKFDFNLRDMTDVLYFEIAYEDILNEAAKDIVQGDSLSLDDMARLRMRFIEYWYEQKANEKYPNELFDYFKKLLDNNFFDIYNYWILGYGNPEECGAWMQLQYDRVEEFARWQLTNSFNFSVPK